MENDNANVLHKDFSSAKFQEHISFTQFFILFLLFFACFCEMNILFASIFSKLPSDIIFSNCTSNTFLRVVLSCLNLSYSNYIIDNASRQREREKIQNFVQSVAPLQTYNPKKSYRNYHRYIGSWLEDDWYTVFKELPIQEYGVFVPIFVPWHFAFQQ